jgi:ferredoxin-NADP reductase
MAQQRIATLIEAEHMGNDTKLLSFRMLDGELGFVGGQYIIVDTGIPIAGNKIAKRAYSIISADDEQREFKLAVRRIGEGPGSNYMHGLQLGTELRFSGPWGKFTTSPKTEDSSLIFATDTGITAALGLLHSQAMADARNGIQLIWLAQSDRYFLPFDFVVGALDLIGARNLAIMETPPVASPERVRKALDVLDETLGTGKPKSAFLSGDGDVVFPIRERLVGAGLATECVRLECFFNNPQRKAAA